MKTPLSTSVYSLADLDISLRAKITALSRLAIDRLYASTLTSIINAFEKATLININGAIFINVSYLHTLLRTSPGAANIIWQDGIDGYASGRQSVTFGETLYITGPDFIGLLDARIQNSIGDSKLYLQYIQEAYYTISNDNQIQDVRVSFIHTIEKMRTKMKEKRIREKNITHCEFTGKEITSRSIVEFAHIQSVATSPQKALDVNNGVIILKEIHRMLTNLEIHDFSGMYNFCLANKYNLSWAETYTG